jgi:hypothetical protein
MSKKCVSLVINFDRIIDVPQQEDIVSKVYRKSDYTEESVSRLYSNFSNNLVEKFLDRHNDINDKRRLIVNPIMKDNK